MATCMILNNINPFEVMIRARFHNLETERLFLYCSQFYSIEFQYVLLIYCLVLCLCFFFFLAFSVAIF